VISNFVTSSTTTDPVISAGDLTVSKSGQVICRLAEFTVFPGERLGIGGANGSGKSTLLRVLGGLERDFTGTCRIDIPPRDRVFVHQTPYLLRGTVLHNVAYGLAARSVERSERRRIALDWLARLGIADLAGRRVDSLSGGEGRRVALARACVLRPKLLLLDEPLADLDESGTRCVGEALAELSDATVLIASPIPLPDGLVARWVELGC